MLPKHTEELLKLMAQNDACDELYWSVKPDGDLRFWIICNDVFWWGAADAEDVTPENIDVLRECLEIDALWGPTLFCARVRGMRPQGAMYKHIDEEMWPHFDACGPEREIDIGNPITQDGEYAYSKES